MDRLLSYNKQYYSYPIGRKPIKQKLRLSKVPIHENCLICNKYLNFKKLNNFPFMKGCVCDGCRYNSSG